MNLAALAFLAVASISVHPSAANPKLVDVAIVRAPLSEAVQVLELHLRHRVQIALSGERRVTFSARGVAPEAALGAVALSGGAEVVLADDVYVVRDRREPTVTLDVKDEEARDILRSIQKQCGIKNLIIDKEVNGKATFVFSDLPCKTALDIVLRTMGLRATTYSNDVVDVAPRSK